MTAQGPASTDDQTGSALLRTAIWVAIGALIAAAIVCVVWVLVGEQNDIVGRAFLTILLLAAFAGVAILDAHLAPTRPAWFVLTSMGVWVLTLLIGAVLIWTPERDRSDYLSGTGRFFDFLVIILVLQLAVLHVRLYTKAWLGRRSRFAPIAGAITVVLVAVLAIMLVAPLTVGDWVDFYEIYWRVVVATTILAAVGTAVVPLVNALFAPPKPRPAPQASAPQAPGALLPWPTYVDGTTPLPVLPDGSPDWGAYYSGHPSVLPQGVATGVPAPQGVAPGAPAPQPAAAPLPPVAPAPPAAPAGHQPIPQQPVPPQGAPYVAPNPAPQAPYPAPQAPAAQPPQAPPSESGSDAVAYPPAPPLPPQ